MHIECAPMDLFLQFHMLHFAAPEIQTDLLWTDQERDVIEAHRAASGDELLALLVKAGDPRKRELIRQLLERQVIRHKLPEFYNASSLFCPPRLNLEQSSSEATAQFKASLFHGQLFIDLTAGMGIDGRFFAAQFREGILVEQSATLSRITSHNLALLQCNNLKFVHGMDAAHFLAQFNGKADLLYLDPARRDEAGGKVVRLQDCEPDPVTLMPAMLAISDRILLKTSPMLDIRAACEALPFVSDVYVVAVDNECKELLFLINKSSSRPLQVHAVNLGKKGSSAFVFMPHEEKDLGSHMGDPATYLYEPNAAVMKSGGFKSIGRQYALSKLHQHTHLYTSDTCYPDFPGRCFEVYAQSKVDKRLIAKQLPGMQAHVSLRNFPGTVQDFRKKMGISAGGDQYVFVTTLRDGTRTVLFCRKV